MCVALRKKPDYIACFCGGLMPAEVFRMLDDIVLSRTDLLYQI
jgi:hypothetical protein